MHSEEVTMQDKSELSFQTGYGWQCRNSGLLISNPEVSPILYRRYFFNIAQGITNTFLRKYRMLYRRIFFFFWSKIQYLSDTFLLKIIFSLGVFSILTSEYGASHCQLVDYYCEGMQCDYHSQNDYKCEVMILIFALLSS